MPDLVWLSWLRGVLTRFLFRRAYSAFALALVAFGMSCFSVFDVWQYIASIISIIINKYWPGINVPVLVSSSQIPSYIIGSILIILGVVLFLFFHSKEEKNAIRKGKLEKYLKVKFSKEASWIKWANKGDDGLEPECIYYIPFRLETGEDRVWIHQIRALRFIQGCACWDKTPSLAVRSKKDEVEFLSDYNTLAESILLEPHRSLNLIYRRASSGPTRRFQYWEMEESEYLFEIEYRFDTDQEDEKGTYCLQYLDGKFSLIDKLSPPPILNDEILKNAVERNIISKTDYAALSQMTDRNRYLIIHDGPDYYDSHPELRHLNGLVKEVHEKIAKEGER